MTGRRVALVALAAFVVTAGAAWRERDRVRVEPTVPLTQQRCVLRDRALAISYPSRGVRITADLYLPETGSLAPAIVMLHGSSPLGRRLPLVRVLAERFRSLGYVVLAPDARAYGESEDPPLPWTPASFDFAADVSTAIDSLIASGRVDSSRVYVVGHSFGGGVAIAAEARDPRIAGLVLIGPARRTMERFLAPNATDRKYFLDRWARDMGFTQPLDFELWQHVRAPLAIEHHLDRLSAGQHAPMLLTDSEREAPADLAFLRSIAAELSGPVEYWTVPGTHHYLGTGIVAGLPCYHGGVIDLFTSRAHQWLSTHP